MKLVGLRTSVVKEDPNNVLAKMNSIKTDRKGTLDLALAYYKMGEYNNPLRIESFLSSMTVLVRDVWRNDLPEKDKVPTSFLKKKIKLVLMNRNSTIFDEAKFCNQWEEYYVDERCSIAHGRESKLIDPRTIHEYNEIANTIGYWAREMISYYIDNFQNLK